MNSRLFPPSINHQSKETISEKADKKNSLPQSQQESIHDNELKSYIAESTLLAKEKEEAVRHFNNLIKERIKLEKLLGSIPLERTDLETLQNLRNQEAALREEIKMMGHIIMVNYLTRQVECTNGQKNLEIKRISQFADKDLLNQHCTQSANITNPRRNVR